MLRKRSRVATSKQAIVGDHSNHPWLPHENPTKRTSLFFNFPSFFKGVFNYKSDPMLSPTSILNFWVVDNTPKFSGNKFTKTHPKNPLIHRHAWEQFNHKQGIGIGLALIDENIETNNNNNDKNPTTTTTTTKQQRRKLVVFGSQLRIQVTSSVFPCFSPESPREFGIKTPRNNLWSFGSKDSHTQVHPEESFLRKDGLTMSDIDEQSEDYTCVISHGPNPKTTHIFGNCIVESCCGKIVGSPSFSSKSNGNFTSFGELTPSQDNFLSFCHHCKKKLGEGRDIYMYRGEKAFCSEECRRQEMIFDKLEN